MEEAVIHGNKNGIHGSYSPEPEWKCKRKDVEVALANHIIVASTYSKLSLTGHGVDESKISVVPYGIEARSKPALKKRTTELRCLFSGRVSLRKGIGYLLAAWQKLDPSTGQLTIAGIRELNPSIEKTSPPNVQYVGPLSYQALERRYLQADVLIFPTLFDGFGQVILEAMSHGIPVISTPHSGAPDIIRDGYNGFIIPAKDEEALLRCLIWCTQNREELSAMGIRAWERSQDFSWGKYQDGIRAVFERHYPGLS